MRDLNFKGNMTLVVVMSIMVLSLMASSIFVKVNSSISMGMVLKQKTEERLIEYNITQRALAYIAQNNISTYSEIIINEANVKISPIKIDFPLDPDYNDSEFISVPTDKKYYGMMDLSSNKFFNVDEYRNYLFYLHEGELKLFAAGTYNLGKSDNGGFVLKKSMIEHYGLGNYSYIEFKGSDGYVVGLSEWNKFKFNGVYKVEITTGNKTMIMLVHKINSDTQLLIKF